MITVVPASVDDAPELSLLINDIIARGGTTAHQTPFTAEYFASHYLGGPAFISCMKAMGADGTALGFQSLGYDDESLPKGWGDIGTFAKLDGTQKGVGKALFAATLSIAQRRGVPVINATIRADNTGGLAYYTKMGFVDYAVKTGVPLKDGTLVDRISKKFDV